MFHMEQAEGSVLPDCHEFISTGKAVEPAFLPECSKRNWQGGHFYQHDISMTATLLDPFCLILAPWKRGRKAVEEKWNRS